MFPSSDTRAFITVGGGGAVQSFSTLNSSTPAIAPGVAVSADSVGFGFVRSGSDPFAAVSCVNVLVYFNQLRPDTIYARSTASRFTGGGHVLTCDTLFQDNTLVLRNASGGYAAVTCQPEGVSYPMATFGIGQQSLTTDYKGMFLATNSPDGTTPVPTLGLYQEQPGVGTHRRIYCDYVAGTITAYGRNTSGAVVNGTVTDPVAWHVTSDGHVAIGTTNTTQANFTVSGDTVLTGTGRLNLNGSDPVVSGEGHGFLRVVGDGYHFINLRDGFSAKITYQAYGGNVSSSLGHIFSTGSTVTTRMIIADDRVQILNGLSLKNVPTSASGRSSGDVYVNAGVLMLVP